MCKQKLEVAKAEALREAKEWLRNLTAKDVDSGVARLAQVRGAERTKTPGSMSSAKLFDHLYYWSAFILYR